MSEALHFSEAAAKKVWELIKDEGNPNLNFRVYVTGGGCSGFQYGFTFDEAMLADDTVVVRKLGSSAMAKDSRRNDSAEEDDDEGEGGDTSIEVRLLIDPMSVQYLLGAEIDYQEDIEGEQFVIRNPNAKTTCGCGSSFTVE